MKKVNFIRSSILLTFCVLGLWGIPKTYGQNYEIGAGLGATAYTGDMLRIIDPGQLGLQGTLFGKRNFDNVWSLRLAVSGGSIHGTDSVRPIDRAALNRNAWFRGGFLEGSAVLEFNFLDYLRTDSEFNWTPYAFFGVGYTQFFLRGKYHATDPGERYNTHTLVIPFGGGVKYMINDRWTLAAEVGVRATLSDYIDKIDSNTPFLSRIPDAQDPDLPSGVNFGNPNDKDWYYFFGVSISYLIPTTKCYAY